MVLAAISGEVTMQIIRITASLSVLMFLLAGCRSREGTAPSEPRGGAPEETNDQSGTGRDAEHVEMRAKEYTFEPSVLRLEPNRQVELTFHNVGTMDHSLFIELPEGEVAFGEDVPAGETRTLSFTTPPRPGEFAFWCPIENHRESGMEGRLIVSGAEERPPVSQR
jgi:plastocyanin